MNRRRFLTAAGGLGLTGASAWVLRNGLGSDADSAFPMQVDTMDAPGSEAGRARVPASDTVTILDLFATWCSPCVEQMDALEAVRQSYGDDVTTISVTNERLGGSLTKSDVREWWRDNDGAWTLGLDPDSELMSALGAGGIPHVAVFDADGSIRWQETSLSDAETIGERVDAALDDA
ncbi:TlpA family protein disulfide reductase [Halorussus litoreus]|uniref:TlpA family protein disulfide reductase n=1 Tax=Halorussus litoreus TaxID=1710536 RepID=UPI000E269B74|nr:TlpA disulfide reductase family protein [Halorussus litoreus]